MLEKKKTKNNNQKDRTVRLGLSLLVTLQISMRSESSENEGMWVILQNGEILWKYGIDIKTEGWAIA